MSVGVDTLGRGAELAPDRGVRGEHAPPRWRVAPTHLCVGVSNCGGWIKSFQTVIGSGGGGFIRAAGADDVEKFRAWAP
jgi:hypothetical protein